MVRRFLLPLCLPLAAPVWADTLYKCTESDGHTIYTNQKPAANSKTCTVLSQDKAVSTFAPPKVRANTPTPGDFPKVSADAQKTRDGDRRRILEEELGGERQKLDDAKKALAEQEAIREGGEKNYQRVLERLKPYQDRVQLHERNVEALEKEIGNLR